MGKLNTLRASENMTSLLAELEIIQSERKIL